MKTFLLVSHDSGTPGGPVDKLHDYLLKNNTVYTIKHPLYPRSDLKSILQFGSKKKLFKLHPLIQYPIEGFVTALYSNILKRKKRIDLAICFDPLAFIDIFLYKKILGVKKIVYYNLDYSKVRFQNPTLNTIYTYINKFALQKCDYFFCLRDDILSDLDPNNTFSTKTYIVGQSVTVLKPKLKRKKNSIVYAGAIGGSIDFIPLLKALQKLQKEQVFFKMDIYGRENDGGLLRKTIHTYKLDENISLLGPVNSTELTRDILPEYMIGTSPYMTNKQKNAPDYLFHGSVLSAKVVDYIAAGLPVIATKINPAFDEIEENGFGFIAESQKDWYAAIKTLLNSKKKYEEYQKNSYIYAKRFDENKIFGNIFKKIFA